MDLSIYGSPQPFRWTHDFLIKILGTGNLPLIQDPLLLNAFRSVNRADFVPEEHIGEAYTDRNIPLEYDEVLTNPTTIARVLRQLQPTYGGNYLELGGGTGYVAALIGFIAGEKGKVYSLERVQWLWERARNNLRKYPHIKNTELLLRDGSLGLADKGPYDGILVSFVWDELEQSLLQQLKIGGKLLVPTSEHQLRQIERLAETEFVEEIIPEFSAYAFGRIKTGIA
jgi:protein-L-isoaspartate(D-aspartate) O-methyltransferase